MNEITKEAILKTEEVLNSIGLNIKFKGYRYWILAVLIKLKHSNYRLENIYKILAEKYKISKTTISSAMNNIVEIADNSIIQDYFKVSYKVTPSSLLELVSKKVERQLQAERR